jgi:hypothetical protein
MIEVTASSDLNATEIRNFGVIKERLGWRR